MRNILNGECYKWKKNKAFWKCLLSAVGMILLVYLTMTAAGQAMGAGGDVLRETGISGMAEQFAGGGRDDVQRDFSLYLGNKRLYPWSNEECGGQGLFQSPGVFGKALVWNTDYHAHEFSHLPCDFDYRADTDRDTACREFVFSKSLYLFWTSAPIWRRCQQYCNRCLRMEPEYGGRNWDYNGADYIFPITDAGIGFTVFCNAAKNNNQRVLDIESDGGLPYRSIHIGLRWIARTP